MATFLQKKLFEEYSTHFEKKKLVEIIFLNKPVYVTYCHFLLKNGERCPH